MDTVENLLRSIGLSSAGGGGAVLQRGKVKTFGSPEGSPALKSGNDNGRGKETRGKRA